MPAGAPAAIVTGSSVGIGKAIAVRLAREGYRVALNYSSGEQRAQAALAECRETSRFITGQKLVADGGQNMWDSSLRHVPLIRRRRPIPRRVTTRWPTGFPAAARIR